MNLFSRNSSPAETEYREARQALDANCANERKAGIDYQTPENAALNDRVRAAETNRKR